MRSRRRDSQTPRSVHGGPGGSRASGWPKEQGTFDPLRAAVSIDVNNVHYADRRDRDVRGQINPQDAVALKDPVRRLQHLLQSEVPTLEVAACGVCYTFKGD